MVKQVVIPAGFRFYPTEEDLINSYLRRKIMGQNLPCNIVEEKSLYAGDPWDVLHGGNQWMVSKTDKGKIVKTIYVFAKLTKKAAAGKLRKKGGGKDQYVRAAGCGTWDGQTGPREIKNDNGEVIGFRKMLVFEIGELNPKTATINMGHWIMHEYSLPSGESDYVVCEIILDLGKKTKRKRRVVAKDQEVVINPIAEKKKYEENVIICCADLPLVHEKTSPGLESQVLPVAVEYPKSSTTDNEKNAIICCADVPPVYEEAGPSGISPYRSTIDHELMPMTDSQEQTLEWDDFIDIDELLNSDFP